MKPNYGIESVTLNVHDLEKLSTFYQEIIGLEMINQSDSTVDLGVKDHILLSLNKVESTHRKQNTGLYHFALLLDFRKALGSFLLHLISTKYPIDGASDHGYSEALYLTDPEGNGIEVYADKDINAWDIKDDGTIEGITIAMDIDGVIKEAEQNINKLNNNTIMGHVHLFVTDLETTEDFYVDKLGFDLKFNYGAQAKFMASGLYHHHIGANTWAGTHLQAPENNDLGIHHFTINTSEDLNTIHDNLLKNQIDVTLDNNTLIMKDNSGIGVHIVN